MQWLIEKSIRLVPWFLRDAMRTWPVFSFLQRKVSGLLEGSEFIHCVDAGPAKGVKFLVRLPEDKGIWTGGYEKEFAEAFASAVPRGAVAYDIGGWHGFFAGVMAHKGARQIHVFEPLPENAARIRSLSELNPNFDIRLHQIALGDADGNTELLISDQSSMAKVAGSAFQEAAPFTKKIPVSVSRLDTLIAAKKLPLPDIMKIDVEGYEASVLRGAIETIKQCRPIIFAEVHSPALLQECASIFGAIHYDMSTIQTTATGKDAEWGVCQIRAQPKFPAIK